MNKGEQLKPSFTLDASGIEKLIPCKIVDVEGDLVYVRTSFDLLYPVHKDKIVDQVKFEEDVETNYRSKTWIHVK